MSQYISIIGVGYVGLSTSLGFAAKGYNVLVYDNDPARIDSIRNGVSSFNEKDIENHLQQATKDGFLRVSPSFNEAVKNSDITFITVGTPSKPDGTIN